MCAEIKQLPSSRRPRLHNSCERGTFISCSHQSVPAGTKGPQTTAQRTMEVVTPAAPFTTTDVFRSWEFARPERRKCIFKSSLMDECGCEVPSSDSALRSENCSATHLSLHICGVNLFGPSSHFSFHRNSSSPVGSDTLPKRKKPCWIYAGPSSIRAALGEVFHSRSQIFRILDFLFEPIQQTETAFVAATLPMA